MKSLKPSKLSSNTIIKQLTQRLADKGTGFQSSIYAGITVKHLLSMMDDVEFDSELDIRINRFKYDPMVHDYMIVKRYSVKTELIKKKFKQRIVVHLDDIDDVLKIKEDLGEYQEVYGYTVKIIMYITTV